MDEELEGLLCANGGAHFDLDHFLSPPPELAQGWLGNVDPPLLPPVGQRKTVFPRRRTHAVEGSLTTTESALGHRAGVIAPGYTGQASLHPSLDPEEGHFEEGTAHERLGGNGDGGGDDGRQSGSMGTSCDGRGSRRESATTSTLIDERTASAGIEKGSAARRESVRSSDGGRDSGGGNGGGGVPDHDLIEAWGLKDPRVARTMMKRMKRMRKFEYREVSRGFDDENLGRALKDRLNLEAAL